MNIQMASKIQMIDLSVSLAQTPPESMLKVEIQYIDHNPFDAMIEYVRKGKREKLWAAYYVGREREYCHI